MNRTRYALLAGILAVGWCLPSVAFAGGKLIQLKNGRVLRAESVRTEGSEVVATLEGGNTMAFPAGVVAQVEDDLAGTQIASGPQNVIRSGREGGASAGFAPPIQAMPEPASEEPLEMPAEQAVPTPELNGGPGVVIDNQVGAPGAANVVPGPGPRNRRVGRLGFKAKPGDN